MKKMDDPRIPRVICTVTLHSKSEQNQVQTSGFGTPNLGPLSLSYCAQERSCDREMSILGNDSKCLSSDYFCQGWFQRCTIYHTPSSSQPSIHPFHRWETEAQRDITCTRLQGYLESEGAQIGAPGAWLQYVGFYHSNML